MVRVRGAQPVKTIPPSHLPDSLGFPDSLFQLEDPLPVLLSYMLAAFSHMILSVTFERTVRLRTSGLRDPMVPSTKYPSGFFDPYT